MSESWIGHDLPPIRRGGEEYFLLGYQEALYLVPNRCPHRGGPLKFGFVDGEDRIVCPLHHTRMMIDEVARPLVNQYGEEAGREIMTGAEFTRQSFDRAGEAMLAVGRAFDRAAARGQAVYAAPDVSAFGRGVSPGGARRLTSDDGPIQVGGVGYVTDPAAFADFPAGAWGRLAAGRA